MEVILVIANKNEVIIAYLKFKKITINLRACLQFNLASLFIIIITIDLEKVPPNLITQKDQFVSFCVLSQTQSLFR